MQKHITTVKDWNRDKRLSGQRMLVYTLGNGSMYDIPRQRGYVVYTKTRSRFFLSLKKAMDCYNSDTF